MKEMVFVSLPMRDRDETAIIAEQQKLFGDYQASHPDAELIESFIADTLMNKDGVFGKEGVFLLGQSLCRMAFADVVIFAKGWENARGCRIEQKVATYYDIPIIYA